jgi:phenylalanyl-tRNA synthetase alpha chain
LELSIDSSTKTALIKGNMTDYSQYFQHLSSVNLCLEKKTELMKNGEVVELTTRLKSSEPSEKAALGQELNKLKQAITQAADARIQAIQAEQEKDQFVDFDPTFYSSQYKKAGGGLHPVTHVTRQVVEIFMNMGFDVAEGPLVEEQYYNFTQLTIPDYHPARAMQDTFFLKEKDKRGEHYVMRTHTSGVQIRYGEQHKPPFRIVSPGRVFRNENIDATHDVMFHQIECLIVEKVVSLAHLKTLIEQFFQQLFGDSSLTARLRPSYFPYTVPSMEIDISNPFKHDPNSRVKGDWIEIGGSGLVHPEVIQNMGLDSKEWQGLAFGFGLDRIAQLKFGVSGMSQFFEGDLRFLRGE